MADDLACPNCESIFAMRCGNVGSANDWLLESCDTTGGIENEALERHADGVRPRSGRSVGPAGRQQICLQLIGLDEAFLSIRKRLF